MFLFFWIAFHLSNQLFQQAKDWKWFLQNSCIYYWGPSNFCTTYNCIRIKGIKVLNPVGRGCPDFLIERNASLSRPISTLGIEDVLIHPDRDGLVLTHEMVPHPVVPWDAPLGFKSTVPLMCNYLVKRKRGVKRDGMWNEHTVSCHAEEHTHKRYNFFTVHKQEACPISSRRYLNRGKPSNKLRWYKQAFNKPQDGL